MALPPTSSKISSDANEVTTFKFDFPNFTGTHTGTQLSLDVNSAAGGGTGQSSLTLNNVILGNGTSPVQFVAPGTPGNVLTDNGTTWISQAPAASGGGPSFFAHLSTNTSVTGGTSVIFDAVDFDTASAYNASTGVYTIPTTGYYTVGCTVNQSGTNFQVSVAKNGVSSPAYALLGSNLGGHTMSGSVFQYFTSGDTLSIYTDSSATWQGGGTPLQTAFWINGK